jgi:hypothetical protein
MLFRCWAVGSSVSELRFWPGLTRKAAEVKTACSPVQGLEGVKPLDRLSQLWNLRLELA